MVIKGAMMITVYARRGEMGKADGMREMGTVLRGVRGGHQKDNG
jgi:hypothetical protein